MANIIVKTNHPYMLASRTYRAENTVVEVGNVQIGGNKVVVMAGPCSVESSQQILNIAEEVKKARATVLRGGVFKPRSSPYSFRGLGEDGLKLLAAAREMTGLPIVTEIMSIDQLPIMAAYADILQIGARNMQNFSLLTAVSSLQKPILLKRGMGNKIDELLMAAEYILDGGNQNVILCERGIRTFETAARNTFDLNAIPILKDLTHLPVIADPSHAIGNAKYVPAIARSAIAAGSDGLLVEVHDDPQHALSDGDQSITPAVFTELMQHITAIALCLGRYV